MTISIIEEKAVKINTVFGILKENVGLSYLMLKNNTIDGKWSKVPQKDFWGKSAIYDIDNPPSEQLLANSDSGFCVRTGEIFVLDLDKAEIERGGYSIGGVYAELQALSYTDFVISTASNGFHLYYRIPANKELLTNANTPKIQGVDARGIGGYVVSLGSKIRYTGDKAKDKGIADGFIGEYTTLDNHDYSEIPVMSDDLYAYLTIAQKGAKSETKPSIEYSYDSPTGDFIPQAFTGDYVEILERLQFIARIWLDASNSPSHDLWKTVIMASHVASEGAIEVRDYIYGHSAFWKFHSDSEDFLEWWNNHEQRDGTNYGFPTLDKLARDCGYGTYSQFELSRVDLEVDTRYLSDIELPQGRNIAIKSQTGTGKSTFARAIAKNYAPSKVLVMSGYTSLVLDFTNELNQDGIPAQDYLDAKKQGRDTEKVMVCTPQYAVKHLNPLDYEFIIIEEIHSIMKQLFMSSHMKVHQKAKALAWLEKALISKATVLMVDARINDNTIYALEKLASEKPYVITNKFIAGKTPVEFLSEDETVVEIMNTHGVVAIACDKKNTATAWTENLRAIGRTPVKITSDTSGMKGTQDFMRDVNTGISQQGTIVYNNSMGTGVDVQVEGNLFALVVEMLPTEIQIQKLNRFRNTKRVICVFQSRTEKRLSPEACYRFINKGDAETEALEELIEALEIEGKSELGQLVDDMAVRLTIEDNESMIDPLSYLVSSLNRDGRDTIGARHSQQSEIMKKYKKQDKDMQKKAYDNFRDGIYIDDKADTVPTMGTQDWYNSMMNTDVVNVWRVVPKKGLLADRAISETAVRYRKGVSMLEMMLNQKPDFTTSLMVASNPDLGKSQAYLWGASYLLLSACAILLPDLRNVVTYEVLKERGDKFMAGVEHLKNLHDALMGRNRQFLNVVKSEKEGTDLVFTVLKRILSKFGIKLESVNRRETIDGKQVYAKDTDGNIIKDYRVKDLDMLVSLLQHREYDKVQGMGAEIGDIVVETLLRQENTQANEVLYTIITNDLASDLAKRMIGRSKSDLVGIAVELLIETGHYQDEHEGF